jgi:hypothetical protein
VGSNELRIWESTPRVASTASTAPKRQCFSRNSRRHSRRRRIMVLGFAPNRHDRTEDGRRPQKGWIARSGSARGRAVSNVPPPQHLCLPLLPPLNRGLLFAWSSMDARYLRGCGCLALIDSCQQEMNAQNGFGQSWMSWSRCLRMPPRQRSMRATCRRREAADGTQRRSSGCASAWPLVHVANRGRGFWRATELVPVV